MKRTLMVVMSIALVFTLSASAWSEGTVDTAQPPEAQAQTLLLPPSAVPVTSCEGLAVVSSREKFNSMGTIVYNYGFDDFGAGFSYPGSPWTKDGITYTSGQNIVVGTATGYAPLSNVMTHNYWTPVTGDIQTSPSTFNMFALDLAFIGRKDPIDLTIYTNKTAYHCYDLDLPIASAAQTFFGFVANTSDEYFTGYALNSDGGGSAPVIDNMTLGLFVWVKEVKIDIKPGSYPNCFNPNERGALPVAIFGNADVDVTKIDPASLYLQGIAVKVAGNKVSNYLVHYEYVNDDPYLDLVVQFQDSDGWMEPGDGYAVLTGMLTTGIPIKGTDSICIVP